MVTTVVVGLLGSALADADQARLKAFFLEPLIWKPRSVR
jgi:hypothetical protein